MLLILNSDGYSIVNMATGERIEREFPVVTNAVTSDNAFFTFDLDTASNNQIVLSVQYRMDAALVVIDINTGKIIRILDGVGAYFNTVVSPDGARVAWAGGQDYRTEIYMSPLSEADPTVLATFDGAYGNTEYLPLAFTPDGQHLIVGEPYGAARTRFNAALRVIDLEPSSNTLDG
jgi:hypothetical protein